MHSTLFICRQQIRLKHTSELVLLCSNYCITPPKDQTETMTLCQTDTRSKDSCEVLKVIQGVWKCPCVSGQLQSSELFGYKYYGQLRLLKISCSHPDIQTISQDLSLTALSVVGLVFSPTTCPAHLNPGIPGLFSSKVKDTGFN